MFKITKDTLYKFYVPVTEVRKLTEEQWEKFRGYLKGVGAVDCREYGNYDDRALWVAAYISTESDTALLQWTDNIGSHSRTLVTAQDILRMIGELESSSCECDIMKSVSRRKELKKLIDDSYAEMYSIDQMLKKHGVQVIGE